ncbi:MAG: hypothetical protein ABI203_00420, partial [Mucilaginibacter sp.]
MLAEEIKNITDRALFERLANDILRQKFPELENLIAGGINEKGETIKGKLDAFAEVSTKHYALIEHTTNDSSLEGKWLYDTANYTGKKDKPDQDDGDLVKSIKHASSIRATISDAKFTVYLTCNSLVDTILWSKVIAVAATGDVTVKLLELSNIQEFLNNNPKGQYLRKVYFGIDYELLSSQELLDIQNENLLEYRSDSFIDPKAVEGSAGVTFLNERLSRSSKDLLLIIAESGLGKSTLAYAFIEQQRLDGNHAIRVTPQMVDDARDAKHLIREYINYYRPKIFWNDETENLVFDRPIQVIVDDLNNFNNPLRILDKLISWNVGSNDVKHQIRFVCPVWPQYFEQIPNREKKDAAYDIFYLRRPKHLLAVKMLDKNLHGANLMLTTLEQDAVVKDAGYDPLLISLYAALIRAHGFFTISQSTTVIKNFVDDKLNLVMGDLAIPNYRLQMLIRQLGVYMFGQKDIAPSYPKLIDWLQTFADGVRIVDRLALDGNLFIIKQNGNLQFRHDRIRNYFLIEGIKQLLPDMLNHEVSFSEPFFIGQIAMAISQDRITDSQIDYLLKINPESVFYTLRYLQADMQANYFDQVISKISDWKKSAGFTAQYTSTIDGILWDLLDTDTKKIGLITAKLPQDHILFLAELRNGDLMGGVKYFGSFKDFEPYFNNHLRNNIISHVRANHPIIETNIIKLLNGNTLTTTGKKGAYLLSGYLGYEALTPALFNNWSVAPEDELYPYFIWAMLHCSRYVQSTELKASLYYFRKLPDEGREKSGYPEGVRNTMLYAFTKLHWRIGDEQIVLLNSFYEEYEELIMTIFGHIDHPIAILRTVEDIGGGLEQAHPQSSYAISFPDDRWSYKRNGYRLSSSSLECLENVWTDNNRPTKQREVALRFWSDNIPAEDAITKLQKIQIEDVDFSEDLIWRRALLGDQKVTGEFLNVVNKKFHWIRVIDRIWNDQCKTYYQALLDQHQKGFRNRDILEDFAKVLRNIPNTDAEELLVNNWHLFENDQAGVQTALYIATNSTKALAASAVNKSKEPKELFTFINQRFGCFETDKEKRLTLEKFQSVEPYLNLLAPFALKEFAEQCFRSNFQKWLYSVLLPYLASEDQHYYQPDISDLVAEIKKQLEINNPFVGRHWLDTIRKRELPMSNAIAALEEWLKDSSSVKGLKFLANCL